MKQPPRSQGKTTKKNADPLFSKLDVTFRTDNEKKIVFSILFCYSDGEKKM